MEIELSDRIKEVEEEFDELRSDQIAFRRQALWNLKTTVGDQRRLASRQLDSQGWPSTAT